MRMEELSEARYLKRADSVEAYLLGLVNDYFKDKVHTPANSMERIIEQCIARVNEELDYDSVGVTGVMLEGDENPRTGNVTITIEEIGAEPAISPKRTAFNVDFGDTINTACMGNDPRLSDARTPLNHEHEIEHIQGLAGRLSTIDGKLSRLLGMAHEHWNQTVLDKLVYSGSKDVIDLADYENIESTIRQSENALRNHVVENKDDINDLIDQINMSIANINNIVNEVYQYIQELGEELLRQANDKSDQNYNDAIATVTEELQNYATKDDVFELNSMLKELYFPVGSMEVTSMEYINFNSGIDVTAEIPIKQELLDEITARGQLLKDCLFQFIITYTTTSASGRHQCSQHMPYVMYTYDNDRFNGFYSASVNVETAKLVLMAQCNNDDGYNEECRTSKVRLLILSKKADPLGIEG